MTTIHIEIDDQTLEVRQGQMLIEAADEAGISIPRFCYHKKLSIAANCRMCLVEVANCPKPLPACATPVSEGMKVYTASAKAKEAQRAVMEFLLINHPLDCPICDQGGQCELQDVALEYGQGTSRFLEGKRVVKDQNLGPLISTDMTRCIHCTRCVRFGSEIAGVREMGATGRGEFVEIGTYVERTVNSELSGNVIDLCPVGALTSKPFRFKARAWELRAFSGVSMHDSVGSHLYFHVLNNRVMRVLPRENESLNEVWLSDRDRFSYEGLYHADRLLHPQVKRDGRWETVDWATALNMAVEKLRPVVTAEPEQLGVLLSANTTTEEAYLAQKWSRAIGCQNIDHRMREQDPTHQNMLGMYPTLGITLPALEHQDAIVLLGSDIHKEQPLIAHRIRKAVVSNGARVVSITPAAFVYHFDHVAVVDPTADLVAALLEVVKAVTEQHPAIAAVLPPEAMAVLASVVPSDSAQASARVLLAQQKRSVLLGQYVMTHPNASMLYQWSRWLAQMLEGTWGEMSIGPNVAGNWLAGAVPHRLPMGKAIGDRAGLTAYQMWQHPRRAYVLMNVEPEYDAVSPALAHAALKQADTVVVLTMYDNPHYREYADIMLPITPPSEMAGTYINAFGEWHGFQAAVMPLGESRPAWKVWRVLANLWGIEGFQYESVGEVLSEIDTLHRAEPYYVDKLTMMPVQRHVHHVNKKNSWVRLAPVSLYAVDGIVRRANALQQTRDAMWEVVRMHPKVGEALGWAQGQWVWAIQAGQRSVRPLLVEWDAAIPTNAVWIPGGTEAASTLGEPFSKVELMACEENKT